MSKKIYEFLQNKWDEDKYIETYWSHHSKEEQNDVRETFRNTKKKMKEKLNKELKDALGDYYGKF